MLHQKNFLLQVLPPPNKEETPLSPRQGVNTSMEASLLPAQWHLEGEGKIGRERKNGTRSGH